jgi:hypothetical protein
VKPDPVGDEIVYRMQFVEIQTARPAVRIPAEAARRLREEETRSMNDRWDNVLFAARFSLMGAMGSMPDPLTAWALR